LAGKIRAVLESKNLNKQGKPKPIHNSQVGFDSFSNNLTGLLSEMKDEMNSMNRERRNQDGRNLLPWHNPDRPTVGQKPSTSTAKFDDDDLFEDRTPMEDDETEEPLEPIAFNKRYSQMKFRYDELRRYDPNNVPVSDCGKYLNPVSQIVLLILDQSGSEDEPEYFNKHFGQRLQFFEQQRKLEIIRNRPFGVRKSNNPQTKYFPSNAFRH
jgi:hypothetical protein